MFARTQLPLLIFTGFVALVVLVAFPEAYDSAAFVSGLVVIIGASALMIVLPWERWSPSWLFGVAVADIVGIAALQIEVAAVIPAVGYLVVFPLLWISYRFPAGILVVAVAGALVVTALPHVLSGNWPSGVLGWVNVLTLPVIVLGISAVVNAAGAQLRRGRSALSTAGVAQAASDRREETSGLLSDSILDTITSGVMVFDSDDGLELANAPAKRMLQHGGISPHEPPFAGADVLLADKTTPVPIEDQIIPRALSGDQVSDELEWLGPPGDQIAVVATSRRVERDDGSHLGTVIVTTDVTELADAMAVLEEFLRTVSHELRTPLTSIVGYLDLIEDSLPDGDPLLAHVGTISRNTDILLARITELLTAADFEPPVHFRSAELSAIADAALEQARTAAAAEGRGLRLEHGEWLPITAEVDPGRIRQLLDQLLSNAVKFTPPGGSVRLDLARADGSIVMRVTDTGVGMSAGDRRQAFDRFYRSRSAHDDAVQGIGLGLAIAKKIVAAHDGTISLESTPGAGTCVTVSIPSP